MAESNYPSKYWWIVLVVVPLVVAVLDIVPKMNSNGSPPSSPSASPVSDPIAPYSSEPRTTEQHSWKLFEAWMRHHPEVLRQYGVPREVKFVSLHEQNFASGYVAYNVTDAWSVWLFTKSNEFLRMGTPVRHLTPGSGRAIDEGVFAEITRGLDEQQSTVYRALIEARVLSPDFKGVGIIGGIGALYIRQRLYDSFGPPQENEFFVPDAVYGNADGYEVIAGLRHGIGPTTPDSPKSVYVLYRDGRFERHVQFPRPHQ